MYFIAMQVDLHHNERTAPLTMAERVTAHSALMYTITSVDVIAGQALHDMRRNKCVTCAIVESTSQQSVLRITFMANEGLTYASLFLEALSQHPVLRLQSTYCVIAAVHLTGTLWSAVCTWGDLMNSMIDPVLHFEFLTPTAIMKDGIQGKRYSAIFPEPADVFIGLHRRWHALGGPQLDPTIDAYVRQGGCIPACYHLDTTEFRLPERTQVGFVGHVTYHCQTNEPSMIGTLTALTRFASFAGVGYQTARQMGAVRTYVGKVWNGASLK